MNNKVIIEVVIIVLVVIGGYFLFTSNQPALMMNDQSKMPDNMVDNMANNMNNQMSNNVVIYSDSGYSPSHLKIKVGETVTWKNESSSGMWTASALHPTHFIFAGTSLDEHCPDVANKSFDQCASGQPGTSWSFTFDKKGTWRYHNHVSASNFGTIIVE